MARSEGGALVRAVRRSTGPAFEDWLAARESAMQRTAHPLAGDVHTAQDLVQNTLAKLFLAWDRVGSSDHIDAYARRHEGSPTSPRDVVAYRR
jgi:DNA-directed RNA polymerase specialized sigma24 family protein